MGAQVITTLLCVCIGMESKKESLKLAYNTHFVSIFDLAFKFAAEPV
jgi:hypothetical protein